MTQIIIKSAFLALYYHKDRINISFSQEKTMLFRKQKTLFFQKKSKSRCNRKSESTITRFGDKDYSREELVAEIGSAMLCNCIGIENEKAFQNSAAYIQSWLKALKNDNKMIVWVAKKAEEAARYILNDVPVE